MMMMMIMINESLLNFRLKYCFIKYLVEAFCKHMKSLRVSLRRSLDLKPVVLHSVK